MTTNADATIHFFPGQGSTTASPGNSTIAVSAFGWNGRPVTTTAFVHELGHFLGCCFGEGTSSGHFVSGEPGIMSDPVCASCLIFSERELDQMGLAAK